MISLEHVVRSLEKFVHKGVVPKLPNDNSPQFIQQTALDMRRRELERCLTLSSQLPENPDYSMDHVISNLMSSVRVGKGSSDTVQNTGFQRYDIPAKSIINIIENVSINIPDILIDVFKSSRIPMESWYIYGVKNPESLTKSVLLTTKPEFILKNKNDRKNAIYTIKREMAVELDKYYKQCDYRAMRIERTDLMFGLMNIDNYDRYDYLVYLSDYLNYNIMVLDIINNNYLEVMSHQMDEGAKYVVIIKYVGDNYLPLLTNTSVSGSHEIPYEWIVTVRKMFESVVLDKFKYRQAATIKKVAIESPPQEQPKHDYTINLTKHTSDFKTAMVGTDIIPLESPSEVINDGASSNIEDLINPDAPIVQPVMTSLLTKPIGKYSLNELQELAKLRGLDIVKDNKAKTGKINMTKAELYAMLEQLTMN